MLLENCKNISIYVSKFLHNNSDFCKRTAEYTFTYYYRQNSRLFKILLKSLSKMLALAFFFF